MKISAPSPILTSMTVPTQQSTDREMPAAAQELPISANSETKEAEATQPLSPQFAELAKRRRALQLQERALKEREKALSSQGAGSDRIELAKLKSSPLSVLQEAGILSDPFYNELTEHLLGNGTAEKPLSKADMEALIQEGLTKKLQEQEQQVRTQTIAKIGRDVRELVASQGDKFKLVQAERKIPDVINLIVRTYDESPPDNRRMMSEEEALQEVEEYLREKYNRIKTLYEPPMPAPVQQQPKQQIGMRTLKNTDTASIASSRRARALAAFINK